MSDFDGPGTELQKPVKQRSAGAFGDLGDRLARAFGTFEPTKADVPTSVSGGELGDVVDLEPAPSWEPLASRFRLAWRGYDRATVDEYVADLERYVSDLECKLATLQVRSASGSSVVEEIQRIGDQTASILRVANEQAEAVTRRAQTEAERCLAEAQSDASAITDAAKQQLRLLDSETDSVWRERERLVAGLRELADGMASLAQDAADRFPTEAEQAEQFAPVAPDPAGEHTNGRAGYRPQDA